jgi:hypothetical protein
MTENRPSYPVNVTLRESNRAAHYGPGAAHPAQVAETTPIRSQLR